MALKKTIEQDNGMLLNYHRIIGIEQIVNGYNLIQVGSYVNEEKRELEKTYTDEPNFYETNHIYIFHTYYKTDYNDNMSAEDAYNYLKTLDIYKDAEDC